MGNTRGLASKATWRKSNASKVASLPVAEVSLMESPPVTVGRNGTATVPFAAMLSRHPRGGGHIGKLRRYVHDADSVGRIHFRGLNDPFGDRLNPLFRRGRGRACREGSSVGTLSTQCEHLKFGCEVRYGLDAAPGDRGTERLLRRLPESPRNAVLIPSCQLSI